MCLQRVHPFLRIQPPAPSSLGIELHDIEYVHQCSRLGCVLFKSAPCLVEKMNPHPVPLLGTHILTLRPWQRQRIPNPLRSCPQSRQLPPPKARAHQLWTLWVRGDRHHRLMPMTRHWSLQRYVFFLGVSAVEGINHSDTRIPRARRRRCLRVFLNTDARMAVPITPTRPALSIACRRRQWCGMG